MFKEIKQMAGLIGQLPKIREEMDRLQARLPTLTADGEAGAGMVRARVNGRFEVVRCDIGDDLWKLHDREMLEDLVCSAVNAAVERMRQQIAEETSKVAGGLGMPGGVNLPGFGA